MRSLCILAVALQHDSEFIVLHRGCHGTTDTRTIVWSVSGRDMTAALSVPDSPPTIPIPRSIHCFVEYPRPVSGSPPGLLGRIYRQIRGWRSCRAPSQETGGSRLQLGRSTTLRIIALTTCDGVQGLLHPLPTSTASPGLFAAGLLPRQPSCGTARSGPGSKPVGVQLAFHLPGPDPSPTWSVRWLSQPSRRLGPALICGSSWLRRCHRLKRTFQEMIGTPSGPGVLSGFSFPMIRHPQVDSRWSDPSTKVIQTLYVSASGPMSGAAAGGSSSRMST